jgi:hypothetical protein
LNVFARGSRSVPVVAIVGSANVSRTYDPPIRDREQAEAAAVQLGRELALQGCRIIVYTAEQPDFIEPAVVRGFVESGAAAPKSVEIWGAYASDVNFPETRSHPTLFTTVPETTPNWEVNFYRSMLATDGVLLLGGGRSTFNAGVIALTRKIAVAPLAAFGGAAERIWHRLRLDASYVTDADLAVLGQLWQNDTAKLVVESLVAQHRRRVTDETRGRADESKRRRRSAIAVLVSFVLAVMSLTTIPLAYALPVGKWSNLAVLVAAPLLASVWGAITRNTYDGVGDWLRTAALGAASGTIAFLLFVAAQMSTNPTVLDGDGARRLIFFLLAIGFIGGFTSQLVYRRLSEQDVVHSAAVTPPRQ